MDNVLAALPPEWWWSVDKLPRTKRLVARRGKKRIELPYSVYLCNGAMIGTPEFASVTEDGDDIKETLCRAVAALHAKVASLSAK